MARGCQLLLAENIHPSKSSPMIRVGVGCRASVFGQRAGGGDCTHCARTALTTRGLCSVLKLIARVLCSPSLRESCAHSHWVSTVLTLIATALICCSISFSRHIFPTGRTVNSVIEAGRGGAIGAILRGESEKQSTNDRTDEETATRGGRADRAGHDNGTLSRSVGTPCLAASGP